MGPVTGLRCVECGREYRTDPLYVCEFCFGPLEVTYDYDTIKRTMNRRAIESRPWNMWRYRELLPLDDEPVTGFDTGANRAPVRHPDLTDFLHSRVIKGPSLPPTPPIL